MVKAGRFHYMKENGMGLFKEERHEIKRFLGEEGDVDDGFGVEARHLLSTNDNDFNSHYGKTMVLENSIPSVGENGRLRLRPDITLTEGQYSGKKANRNEVLEDDLSDSSEYEADGDNALINAHLEEIEAADSQYNTDDSDDKVKRPLGKDKDTELELLNKEYEELRKQEDELLANLKAHRSHDSLKGAAVKEQKALWDRTLELRIILQKVVTGANRLPRGQSKLLFCSSDEQTEKSYKQLKTSATEALNCLMDLQEALIDQNPAIQEAYTSAAGDGQSDKGEEVPLANTGEESEHMWRKLDLLYSRIVPYRNNSIDRWYRKTQIATGAAAFRGRLHAFDKPISQQVSAAMQDPSRLIHRMLLKNSSHRVLGQHPDTVVSNEDTVTGAAFNNFPQNEKDEVEVESFDDSEFYQQLLNEFLESSYPGTMSVHVVGKHRNKKRKVVDRRASKGRKIRYNVLEPLVNFMAPEPMALPPMATNLFANLFGRVST